MSFGESRKISVFSGEIEAFFESNNYSGIYYELHGIKQFLIDFENQLSKNNVKITTGLNKETPETKTSLSSQPHINNSLNTFPDLLRKSNLITTYSFLEVKLYELILLTQEHLPSKLSFEDYLNKKKRKKARVTEMLKYFEDELLPLFDSKKEITKIENFRFIRDCIIHCNGNISISKSKKKILQIVEKSSDLDLENDILSIKSKNYVFELVNLILNLFSELTSELSKEYG